MSADENERIEAYKRKLAIWDYNLNIEEATKEGRESGLQEGLQEVAKKMKEEGDTIEHIIKITGLSKEEIEKL